VATARLRTRFDIVLFAGCVLAALLPLAVPAAREGIAGALRRTVVAPLVGLQQGAERWRNAWLAREAQLMAGDSVSLRMAAARAMEVENDHLRDIIGLGSRLQWGFVPAEALQGSVRQDFVTSLVLTAGSNAGVRRFSAVVAPDGLVGHVQTADPTMSIALLYTDPDFRACGVSADGEAFGMIYPHLTQARARDRQYLMELRDVPWRRELAPGTAIITCGLGGVYPAGIAVGTVVREIAATAGLSRSYLVLPAVDPSRVTSVLILDPQRATQGVGNIWTSAVAADTARARFVAAGDSLQRLARQMEDRARQASLDSLRQAVRDSVLLSLGLPIEGNADSVLRSRMAPPPAVGAPGQGTTPPPGTPGTAGAPGTGPQRAVPPVPPVTRVPPDTGAVRPPGGGR
jgi:cell shape-determining protein MreC